MLDSVSITAGAGRNPDDRDYHPCLTKSAAMWRERPRRIRDNDTISVEAGKVVVRDAREQDRARTPCPNVLAQRSDKQIDDDLAKIDELLPQYRGGLMREILVWAKVILTEWRKLVDRGDGYFARQHVSDIFGLGEGCAPGFGTSATFSPELAPADIRRWSLPPAAVV